jgi:glycosyltransferase involved in cell wall biosynthesis
MTVNPKKLIFLFVDNEVADFLQYRLGLALFLVNMGVEVHVALPSEPGMAEIEDHGITVHEIYIRRFSTSLWQELRTFGSLALLYWRLRPAVLHHLCLKPVLYGGIAARLLGIQSTVGTLTGLGPLFTNRSVKMRVLRRLTVVGLRFAYSSTPYHLTVQNPENRDYIVSNNVATKDRVWNIRGSGVDLSVFVHKREPEGTPVALMACRLLWEKGVGEFVAAARALRERGLEVRFLLIGARVPGHPSEIPLSDLEHWCSTRVVEWLNWQDDMPTMLNQSHIVCLPTYYAEGIPRILIEAAAAGRPIVTTDSPGCREVVADGQNGLFVPAKDPEALASAISKLVQNDHLRTTLGSRGRAIAAKEFSVDQIIGSYLEVYRRASRRIDVALSES